MSRKNKKDGKDNVKNLNLKTLDFDMFSKNQQLEMIQAQIRENHRQSHIWNNFMIVAIIFLCIGVALLPSSLTTNLPKTPYIVLLTIGIISLFIGITVLVLVISFKIYLAKYNKFLESPMESPEDEGKRKLREKLSTDWTADKDKVLKPWEVKNNREK